MNIIYQERVPDSPYIEKIMHGWTAADETFVRPAEAHWHMVFSKRNGCTYPLIVGPWTPAGVASWTKDAEILWIKFKLGIFIPHLPTRNLLNTETVLPKAASKSFWLKSSAWQFPNFENADTFVEKLVRAEVLVCDRVVTAALQDQLPEMPSRTIRHRFLQATGLSQNHIRRLERAQQAAALLEQGNSILDVVSEVDYADQSHLTRSLKKFTGYTPSQIIQLST